MVAAVLFCVLGIPKITNEVKYRKSIKYMETEQYDLAEATLSELGEYKDSKEKCEESHNLGILLKKYEMAVAYYDKEEVDLALEAFLEILDYKDSRSYINQCNEQQQEIKYLQCIRLYEAEDYENAIEGFKTLGDYKESSKYIEDYYEIDYQNAIALYEEGDYDEAYKAFIKLDEYKKSEAYKRVCTLWKKIQLFDGERKNFGVGFDERLYCSMVDIYETVEESKGILSEAGLREKCPFFDSFCTNIKETTWRSKKGDILECDSIGKITQGGEIFYTIDKYGHEIWSWGLRTNNVLNTHVVESRKDIAFSNDYQQITVKQYYLGHNGSVERTETTVFDKQ